MEYHSSSVQEMKFQNSSKDRFRTVRETLLRHIAPGKVPGFVSAISLHGHTQIDCLGTMSFASSSAMTRDALFRLASTTKPITAVAAMTLVEESKIRLDDPVDNWLPELKDRKVLRTINSDLNDTVPAKRRITVRDLLTFRSGYGELGFIAPTSPLAAAMQKAELPLAKFPFPYSQDEFMNRLGSLPLAFQPGEVWLYHMGLEILGVLISRVSGLSLSQFMSQRIFEPLAMQDTGFFVPKDKQNRLPLCYGTDFSTSKTVVLHQAGTDYVSQTGGFESGAGGLVSSADDLLKFGLMLMNYGSYKRERILSRPTVELMATDQITVEQKLRSPFFQGFWDSYGWGLGMGVITRRSDIAMSPGRFGWDGAFGSSLWIDPKERLVGVLLAQRSPEALALAPSVLDFWTSAYQLIE